MGGLGLGVWFGSADTVHAQQPEESVVKTARKTSNSSSLLEKRRKQPESYGAMLLKMLLAVMVITVLAYVVIRFGLKRFLPGAQSNQAMHVLIRQPLEPKRSLLLVKVASKHLLLASTESGIALLTEVGEQDVAEILGTPGKHQEIPREFSLELDEPMTPPEA